MVGGRVVVVGGRVVVVVVVGGCVVVVVVVVVVVGGCVVVGTTVTLIEQESTKPFSAVISPMVTLPFAVASAGAVIRIALLHWPGSWAPGGRMSTVKSPLGTPPSRVAIFAELRLTVTSTLDPALTTALGQEMVA